MLRRIAAVVGALGLLGGVPATVLGPWLIEVLFKVEDPVLDRFDFFLMSAGTVAYMFAMVLGQALMVFKRHNLQLLGLGPRYRGPGGHHPDSGDVAVRVIVAYALGSLATVLAMLAALRLSFPGSGCRSHRRAPGRWPTQAAWAWARSANDHARPRRHTDHRALVCAPFRWSYRVRLRRCLAGHTGL